ncbi:hypothetical protein D3C77_609670 [compost metagenome]
MQQHFFKLILLRGGSDKPVLIHLRAGAEQPIDRMIVNKLRLLRLPLIPIPGKKTNISPSHLSLQALSQRDNTLLIIRDLQQLHHDILYIQIIQLPDNFLKLPPGQHECRQLARAMRIPHHIPRQASAHIVHLADFVQLVQPRIILGSFHFDNVLIRNM